MMDEEVPEEDALETAHFLKRYSSYSYNDSDVGMKLYISRHIQLNVYHSSNIYKKSCKLAILHTY